MFLLISTFCHQEALPPNATHETVRNQFKQFGNVAYVSLPKYRTSGRIKEFAFVEFEDKSSVEKCLSAFRQFDGIIGQDTHDPENLKSVVAYVKEQEELEKEEEEEKQENSNEDDDNVDDGEKTENKTECKNDVKVETDDNQQTNNPTKRRDEPMEANDDVPPSKRIKVQEQEVEPEPQPQLQHENENENEHDQEHDQEREQKENHEEIHDNTTDEKASVTDENQDHKKKR